MLDDSVVLLEAAILTKKLISLVKVEILAASQMVVSLVRGR